SAAAREWSCACTPLCNQVAQPRCRLPAVGEPLGRRRVREQQEIREPRRGEVTQVLQRERPVRLLERFEVVGQLERPAVGDPLVPAREGSHDRKRDELETGEEEEGKREV